MNFHELAESLFSSLNRFSSLPQSVWTHFCADALLGVVYLFLLGAWVFFCRRRADFKMGGFSWAVGSFLFLQALLPILHLAAPWFPIYGPEGYFKAATAIFSAVVGILILLKVPRILSAVAGPPLWSFRTHCVSHYLMVFVKYY